MSKPDEYETIVVPREVWETAFACFAGHVGREMMNRKAMPKVWEKVFRFECDDAALARLGIRPAGKDA